VRRGRRKRKPYLCDGNLVVFKIPPELADSLRISDIDIKEVCIRALWEAVERGREGCSAESLGIGDPQDQAWWTGTYLKLYPKWICFSKFQRF